MHDEDSVMVRPTVDQVRRVVGADCDAVVAGAQEDAVRATSERQTVPTFAGTNQIRWADGHPAVRTAIP